MNKISVDQNSKRIMDESYYLQLVVDLCLWIFHVMPMSVEAQGREERHKEHISRFWIRNPYRFHVLISAIIQKWSHHPVLHAVLLLETWIAWPWRQVLCRQWGFISTLAVQHPNMELARKVVHVDLEGAVCTGWGWGLKRMPEQWEDAWSDIKRANEDGIRDEEDKAKCEREQNGFCISVHLLGSTGTGSGKMLSISFGVHWD